MSGFQLKDIHFMLMDNVLPVGLALTNRVQKAGPTKVVQDFISSNYSLDQLREEGSFSSKLVREKLDELYPGLGNPVVDIEVSVNPQEVSEEVNSTDQDSLVYILNRIDKRLNLISSYLDKPVD
ncbi:MULTISPECIES: hypothetical protein [unclassified Prochlorococcus]|uniref:hypothetical protein n=1 Tax=unclassified Prochlorococcus TaxID=2627481 RepID=UPI000533A3BD|nr:MULTISPECIES: hypothetical protein [unclassified Prochlorococcus]KGG16911.1 hypothetical protein EV06_0758 [Prochlorococcus sp. MIT 0602]KGG18114.1 hypothetical protein EV07_0026 [Prochlorococcus sp. MIT 0603]